MNRPLVYCRAKEAVLLLYGPEPVHEAEALAKAIIEPFERLTTPAKPAS
ncbi:hypothetical protein [Mesorhizobium wenxiniae]|nr:hypothetical protein [Mesorhizobium wenxiniae]